MPGSHPGTPPPSQATIKATTPSGNPSAGTVRTPEKEAAKKSKTPSANPLPESKRQKVEHMPTVISECESFKLSARAASGTVTVVRRASHLGESTTQSKFNSNSFHGS